MQTIERRGLERFDLKIPAKIQAVTAEQVHDMQDLMTSNICSGGAFFQTSKPFPEGTDVKIDLMLNVDKLNKLVGDCHQVYIKINGKVNRTERHGMSVTFDNDYLIIPIRREASES